MLFGVKLQNEIYPPWRQHYINYDGLKRLLKENVLLNNVDEPAWSEKDESNFAHELDTELEKVYSYQISKYQELDSEITKLEQLTENYLNSLTTNGNNGNINSKSSFDVNSFQTKLEELLGLANELDHFARINFTGFLKIVKKHDRLHKGYSVKALLNVRMKSLPLNNISEDTSPYLFRISTLYAFLRDQTQSSSLSTSLTNSIQKLSSSGKLSTTPSASVNGVKQNKDGYKVLKFWIHPDNLMEIKTSILRHLPVLIYNNSQDDDDEYTTDPTITSLYFDNNHFELYNQKLLKNLNKTPSLRIRWTGNLNDQPELTIEKKTFDYDTGESNDVRLNLKEKYINDFIFAKKQSNDSSSSPSDDIPGLLNHRMNSNDEIEFLGKKKQQPSKLTLAKYTKKLEKKSFQKETVDKLASNFKELQDFINNNDLQPALRTVYTRNAFQIPGDDKIRITIDSDILFIREDAFDQTRPIRNPNEWHRKDIDSSINNPYALLRKGEYSKFPYSVMEIKISNSIFTNTNSKTLAWVNDLTNGHLVKEVPNFSKFIQGISSLFLEDDNLDILPFWLPELESDIRKNPEQAYKDSKDKKLRQLKHDEMIKTLRKKVSDAPKATTNSGTTHLDQIIEDVENEDEEDLDDNESSDDEDDIKTNDSTLNRIQEAHQKQQQEQQLLGGGVTTTREAEEIQHEDNILSRHDVHNKKNNIGSYLLPIFTKSSKLDAYESEDEEVVLPPGVIKPKVLIRQSGPVKVEAKVWLANERTFVRWLHVTTMLSALTFAVYSSVHSSHFPQLATGIAYIYFALTLFSGVWAYGIYNKRLDLIKQRSGNHLDGVFGPLVVASVLVITLILEFYSGVKKFNDKHNVIAPPLIIENSMLNVEFMVNNTNFTQSDEIKFLHPLTRYVLEKIVSMFV
ncbi:hypothetical protein B5S32_g2866 [[Candida] boidinii]|nr:hypothetical protein B5S32_g2866 [[Candida] boidinii]